MDLYFLKKRYKIRVTDDPWIIPAIRKAIKTRKWIFKEDSKRTQRWKTKKQETDRMIKEAKRDHNFKYVEQAKRTGDPALYFKVVNRLKDREAPKGFDVLKLLPGQSEKEATESLAEYFYSISNQHHSLSKNDIPANYTDKWIQLTRQQITNRLKTKRPTLSRYLPRSRDRTQ